MCKPGLPHKEAPHETRQQFCDTADTDQLQKHHMVASRQEQNWLPLHNLNLRTQTNHTENDTLQIICKLVILDEERNKTAYQDWNLHDKI